MTGVSAGSIAGATIAVLVVALSVAVRAVVGRRRTGAVMARLDGDRPGRRDAGRSLPTVAAPPRLRSALAEAGVDGDADRAATGALVGLAAAALVGGAAGGVTLGLLLPAVVAAAAVDTLVAMRGRGDRRYAAALPLALDLIGRSLRTGASLPQAVGEAARVTPGPVGDDLSAIDRACRLGRPFTAAVDAWAEARALPSVRLTAAALSLAAETGGARARAIDGVAATLREHLGLEREVRALTSQARTSGLVIAVAPVAFCAITVVTDADTAAFLLRTPLGLLLLVVGLALDGLAAAWMHRLTSRVAT